VAKLPSKIQEIEVSEGTTVGEVLDKQGLSDTKGYEVRKNGQPTQLTDQVGNGDSVFLVAKIEGNNA